MAEYTVETGAEKGERERMAEKREKKGRKVESLCTFQFLFRIPSLIIITLVSFKKASELFVPNRPLAIVLLGLSWGS